MLSRLAVGVRVDGDGDELELEISVPLLEGSGGRWRGAEPGTGYFGNGRGTQAPIRQRREDANFRPGTQHTRQLNG